MLERADGDSKEVFSLFIGCQRGGEIKKGKLGRRRRTKMAYFKARAVLVQTPLFFSLIFFLPGFSCTAVRVNTVEITTCELTDLHVLQIS